MSVREARRGLIRAGFGATLSAAAASGSIHGSGPEEQLAHLAEIAAYIGESDPLMIGAAFLLEAAGHERRGEQLRLELDPPGVAPSGPGRSRTA